MHVLGSCTCLLYDTLFWGDVARVLVGVDVPLVLRPHGEVGLFKLLGESYIHGAMEGQVKGMVERKQVFEKSLIVC